MTGPGRVYTGDCLVPGVFLVFWRGGDNNSMTKYIIRRILNLIPILLGVSLVVFLIVHLAPGDPITIMLGEQATPEEIARLQRVYGFDQPLHIQYFRWLGNALRGDLGRSIRQWQPVTHLIFQRLGATFELALMAIFIAILIAIPLGILAAVKQSSWVDFTSMVGSLIGISMPSFWLGLMLLTYIALHVPFFPVFGRDASFVAGLIQLFTRGSGTELYQAIRFLALPAMSLGTAVAALLTRLTRSSMLEVLGQDYIRTARAKGLNERLVLFRHALKNAMLPVVTVLGLQLGVLLGGAVVTETVFAWPGVGRLIVNSISQRDFPIIQAGTLMLAVIFSLVNLIVDISYSYLNPRIRYD